MTSEEAIQELKRGVPYASDWDRDFETFENAINMGLKALERENILDKIRSEIKEQIDYHDNEHRKYDSEEEFGISLGLELALAMINKEIKPQESEVEK